VPPSKKNILSLTHSVSSLSGAQINLLLSYFQENNPNCLNLFETTMSDWFCTNYNDFRIHIWDHLILITILFSL
jgi:hypothetical protein